MKQRLHTSARILFATCSSALCLIALSVEAATITVTNTNDSGSGSLRQALANANDGDTINFNSLLNGQTITLTSGELFVDKSVTISGPGPSNLTADGNHASRIFHVTAGVTATISGLTITNGQADGVFPGNAGGGIYNDHSTLTVSNCTLSSNSAYAGGGAIFNDAFFGSATLEVLNSTLNGNLTTYLGTGGGILNYANSGSATLRVINSTLDSNSASYNGFGGGICSFGLYSGSATVEVVNSTLSGNSADRGGGGICSFIESASATVEVLNSTLSGNSGGASGGGVFNICNSGSATLEVVNSTLSGNSASFGDSIWNGGAPDSAMLDLTNTILNAGASGENIFNNFGIVTSNGYNLSSDDGGGLLTPIGDQINTDPLLGPLQDNGGPTFTHELLSGSPAIDAGDPNFMPPPDYDQRGTDFPRVFNGRVDIGAFEVQTVTPAYAGQVQPPINPDGSSTFNVRRGVVPVKFNLTLGGVATCELPLATIAVTRTAGGVIGSVNESVYTANADTGSNFRIDSCQYVYNLNSRALGVGTYRVDILIDGQVVGSAVFALN